MPFGLELEGEAFVESGEAAAVGVCCADDDDVHGGWILRVECINSSV